MYVSICPSVNEKVIYVLVQSERFVNEVKGLSGVVYHNRLELTRGENTEDVDFLGGMCQITDRLTTVMSPGMPLAWSMPTGRRGFLAEDFVAQAM